MSHRTQTLLVEAERLLHSLGLLLADADNALSPNRGVVREDTARERLDKAHRVLADFRAALSQPEHQGDGRRIANLEALKPNWDSHGGEPVTKVALDKLRGFDCALSYVPIGDGGVQVEFHALGLDFEAVIDKDGQVTEYDLQPSAPVLSDEERERLEKIAASIDDLAGVPPWPDDADFLRKLASREHRGEEGGLAACTCLIDGRSSGCAMHGSREQREPIDLAIEEFERRAKGERVTTTSRQGWLDALEVLRSLVPDLPAKEVERLRELEAVADAARAWAEDEYPGGRNQAAEFEADCHALAVIDALATLGQPPSDPQGDQEQCKRCGGSGEIVHPPSKFDIKHGESRRLHERCPDCNPAPAQVEGDDDLAPVNHPLVQGEQPEGGDGEDWPEVMLHRLSGCAPQLYSANPPVDAEACRYVPATSQDPSGLEAVKTAAAMYKKLAEERGDRAERAETALGDLAEEFEWLSGETTKEAAMGGLPVQIARHEAAADAFETAHDKAREKAAKLKGGEG